jgi:hypothetical protein
VEDARPHLLGQVGRHVERARHGRRVGRVLLQSAEGELPKALRRVGVEQVGAPVDRVHGLTIRALAGVPRGERRVGGVEGRRDAVDLGAGE